MSSILILQERYSLCYQGIGKKGLTAVKVDGAVRCKIGEKEFDGFIDGWNFQESISLFLVTVGASEVAFFGQDQGEAVEF